MIKRIVRLSFEMENVEDFLTIFEDTKQAIRQFEGCHHLELWQSTEAANVFFTYSFWSSEAALDNYRHSALFEATWKKTKALFSEKAMAWSVQMKELVRPSRDNL